MSTAPSAATDPRRDQVVADLDLTRPGLEIGPSYRPLLPKAQFPTVETLDHADAQTLRAKYREMGHPEEIVNQIVDVDHIWQGGSLTTAVPEGRTFAFIVGSHLIEHTTDVIGFLQDCQALLDPGGRAALVVPDRGYCFDYFQPLTNAGAAIDAHLYPQRFHPPGQLLNHLLYAVTRDGQLAWGPNATGTVELQFRDLDNVTEWMDIGRRQEEYFDIHRWRYTPSSFELLVTDLACLGYHHMRLIRAPRPGGHEFSVTLENDPSWTPEYDADWRLRQLLAIEAETVAATGRLRASAAASEVTVAPTAGGWRSRAGRLKRRLLPG